MNKAEPTAGNGFPRLHNLWSYRFRLAPHLLLQGPHQTQYLRNVLRELFPSQWQIGNRSIQTLRISQSELSLANSRSSPVTISLRGGEGRTPQDLRRGFRKGQLAELLFSHQQRRYLREGFRQSSDHPSTTMG